LAKGVLAFRGLSGEILQRERHLRKIVNLRKNKREFKKK